MTLTVNSLTEIQKHELSYLAVTNFLKHCSPIVFSIFLSEFIIKGFTLAIRLFFPIISIEKVIEVGLRVIKPNAQQRTNEEIGLLLVGHPIHARKLAIKNSDEAENGTRLALGRIKDEAVQF